MSFWSQQAVSGNKENGSSESASIINSTPVTDSHWRLADKLEYSQDLAGVSEFIGRYYDITGSNIPCLTDDFYHYLQQPYALRVVIRLKDKVDGQVSSQVSSQVSRQIVGTCFTFLMTLKMEDKTVAGGYTTYLCVHPDHSKQGLAACLIRRLMVESNTRGSFVGYHLMINRIGDNSIPVTSWWYPVNESLCQSLGFYRSSTNTATCAVPSDDCNVSLVDGLLLESFELHLDWLQQQVSNFSVSLDFNNFLTFLRQAPSHQSYVVSRSGKPISFVCWYNMKVYFKSIDRQVNIAMMQFFIRPSIAVFHKLVSEVDSPLIYFYELAQLTPAFFRSIGASLAGVRWLNWYNWTGKYSPSQVLLPIF